MEWEGVRRRGWGGMGDGVMTERGSFLGGRGRMRGWQIKGGVAESLWAMD